MGDWKGSGDDGAGIPGRQPPKKSMSPNVYIIAGPNGAGKTTFAREFLPNFAGTLRFVNADLIAQGLSPLAPDAVSFRAGKMMLVEIHRLVGRRVSFGFESTLSGRSYASLLRQMKEADYYVALYFLWVASADLSVARIRERVRAGGHSIPEDVARRRFGRSIRNFFRVYRRLADEWTLLDNSQESPVTIAFSKGAELDILDSASYEFLFQKFG